MLWTVPASFTPAVLAIYNERFTLPQIAANARAAVIGQVSGERRYRVCSRGSAVIDVPIEVLAGAIAAQRTASPPPADAGEDAPSFVPEAPFEATLLAALAHSDVCSRRPLIDHYDTEVRGATVIPSGYADAGVIVVKRGARAGIALSVDGNPRFGAVSSRAAAAHAVVEAARNVAAVGATPIGLTDCLNYGNPEDPQAYRQLCDGVEGLAEAAMRLELNRPGEPLPFVSGNVSLYNESSSGGAIAPSAIVGCIGRVDDVGKVVTMRLTGSGNALLLLGQRSGHLRGSVFEAVSGVSAGGSLPPIDYAAEVTAMRAVIEGIRCGAVTAAHDISDGGLLVCVSEMCFGGDGVGEIGARLSPPEVWAPGIHHSSALFGEKGGFVVEVPAASRASFASICAARGAKTVDIGTTGGDSIAVEGIGSVALDRAAEAWTSTLRELYA